MADDVETLAAEFHEVYQQEARRQGDVRHADAYADLPERVKDFDRALARVVLEREAALSTEAERLRPLARFACILLTDNWPGEMEEEVWDAAVAANIIRQKPGPPCGRDEDCEWCDPDDDKASCWEYVPEVARALAGGGRITAD